MSSNQLPFFPKILSIQSSVVSGYVGNKSAVFPLQILGFEVDIINSVQFSNHTGYKFLRGQVLKDEDLDELYEGLKENQLDDHDFILTGYIGEDSFLKSIVKLIKQAKEKKKETIYVCDPVLGDNGKFYVPESLSHIYRNQIVPLCDILTPNQFEAEQLTGLRITDLPSAVEVISKLHSMGPKLVSISSCSITNSNSSTSKLQPITALASKIDKNGEKKMFGIQMPRLEAEFTGSGDLYAALLLACNHRHPDDLKLTLEKVASTMLEVLQLTLNYLREIKEGPSPMKFSIKEMELKLIQSKGIIESLQPKLQAYPIH